MVSSNRADSRTVRTSWTHCLLGSLLTAALPSCSHHEATAGPCCPPHGLQSRASSSRRMPASPEEFIRSQRNLNCRLAIRSEPWFGTAAAFHQALSCHPSGLVPQESPAEGLRTGRVVFDAAAAASCLEYLSRPTAYPDPRSELVGREACASALRGMGLEGDECEGDLECAVGLECRGDECPSRCRGLPESGERCAREGRCAASSDRRMQGHEPCRGTADCTRREQLCVGGACTDGQRVGDPCGPNFPCGEASRCVRHRCVVIALPGEACGERSACPHGFGCLGGSCVPLPMEGESCREAGSCAQGVCASGVCTTLPAGRRCDPVHGSAFGDCESGRCPEGGTQCPAPPGFMDRCVGVCDAGLTCRRGSDGSFLCLDECGPSA